MCCDVKFYIAWQSQEVFSTLKWTYSEVPNNSTELNNGIGWKNLPKLIIVLAKVIV